jgi:hypothetical protein
MHGDSPAHVLIVAHKTAASPSLLRAVRDRATLGPCWFHLLVPLPAPRGWHHEHDVAVGQRVLAAALPLLEEAAHRPVDGSVSARHDPMEAIEEALMGDEFDELILSTLPRSISRWLHIDLPRRVAHLGLPLTTVIADERDAASLR